MTTQFFSLENQFFLAAHFQIPRILASKKMHEWYSQWQYWRQTNPMMSLPQLNQKFIESVSVGSPLVLQDSQLGRPLPWDVIVNRDVYSTNRKFQKSANIRRHDDQELGRNDSIDRF
jgi:hypothetical protein